MHRPSSGHRKLLGEHLLVPEIDGLFAQGLLAVTGAIFPGGNSSLANSCSCGAENVNRTGDVHIVLGCGAPSTTNGSRTQFELSMVGYMFDSELRSGAAPPALHLRLRQITDLPSDGITITATSREAAGLKIERN
jgi:hypothetical protein